MLMGLWKQSVFYVAYTWRFMVLRRPEPLIYGIALAAMCADLSQRPVVSSVVF
jgi:hypothetical protein